MCSLARNGEPAYPDRRKVRRHRHLRYQPYANNAKADFLNWSLINAGSFDYAGDAWGFTYARLSNGTRPLDGARRRFRPLGHTGGR